MKENDIEGLVSEVMDGFNFEKVYRTMKFLDWKWYEDGEMTVPSIWRITETARRLLTTAAAHIGEEFYITGTGGFSASVEYKTELVLRFHVAEYGWDSDWMEEGNISST